MNWFQKLLSNPFLLIGLSSWFWAQLIKTIIHAIVTKSIDFTRLIGDGGMPSGHSATVSSLATAAAHLRPVLIRGKIGVLVRRNIRRDYKQTAQLELLHGFLGKADMPVMHRVERPSEDASLFHAVTQALSPASWDPCCGGKARTSCRSPARPRTL